MQQRPSVYFEHFAELLKVSSRQVTMDITPSYAGLGAEVLEGVRAGFEERQIHVKAVFLMRDPVERCWSAVRMQARKELGHTDVNEADVLSYARSEKAEMRTRYDATLSALESVFGPEELYIGFYETMHSELPDFAISAFLQVPYRPRLTEQKVNTSPKRQNLGEDARGEIARHYRDVYDCVAGRFPQAVKLWDGYRYL